MIYYKPLELDYYPIIVRKCLTYIKTMDNVYNRLLNASWYNLNLEILKKVCPEIELAFKKYDLKLNLAAVYIMYNYTHTSIHIDGFSPQARINLPLLNCKNTYTNFYKNEAEPIKWCNPESGKVSYTAVGDSILVDRVEIIQATIIRTNVFHSVDLPIDNPVPRITLTLGFDKDPVFFLGEPT